MGLTDPTSGSGYSYGQKFPSAHATTIATQLPSALKRDGIDSITGTVNVASGADLTVQSGGQATVDSGGDLAVNGTLTLGGYGALVGAVAVESGASGPFSVPSGCTVLRYTGTPGTAEEYIDLPNEAANSGRSITITRTNTSDSIRIRDSAGNTTIASLPGGGVAAVTVVSDGTSWRCCSWSGNTIAGVV